MFSLFFEVETREGQAERYLELAASLKPRLEEMGGCLFIDRFRSLSQDHRLLSYQIWRDEGALTAWRVDGRHHRVQETGRERVFSDYRIRIAQVVHEARPGASPYEPERRTPYNDPARRPPTFALVAESAHPALPADIDTGHQAFVGVYRPEVYAHLVEVASAEAGIALGRRLFEDDTTEYFRVVEVFRDYGMHDRAEAPQYYPPVERAERGPA